MYSFVGSCVGNARSEMEAEEDGDDDDEDEDEEGEGEDGGSSLLESTFEVFTLLVVELELEEGCVVGGSRRFLVMTVNDALRIRVRR